jgi:hypothetical protein
MTSFSRGFQHRLLKGAALAGYFLPLLMVLASGPAEAVPAFARQTGQNCIACHAGGQFPELTPYGRIFKLTGYTLGTRTIPFSVMGVLSYNQTQNIGDDTSAYPRNGDLAFATGSIFVAGKATDYIGAFLQWTYDNYAQQNDAGQWVGHSNVDNMDIRAADRWIEPDQDLLYGLTVNNNVSVQDPWNTAPAWMAPYVPNLSSTSATSLADYSPLIYGLGQQVAGLGAYVYWKKTLYGEVALYRTANGAFSLFSAGISDADTTKLSGGNPYWRLAWTGEWGPHNLMVGTFGLVADVYPDSLNPSGPTDHYRDIGVDAQYQYLLDPHSVTVLLSNVSEKVNWANPKWNPDDPDYSASTSNASDTLRQFRAKVSYTYRAKYGASLAYYNTSGSTDSLLYDPDGLGLAATPGTQVWVPEVFWLPVQYVRIGAQYWAYNQYNGATSNYDGNGRDASNNNTFYLYVWAAY